MLIKYEIFQLPSFDATCSVASTITSRSRKMNSVHNSNNNNADKVAVPGIGFATQFKSGDIRIDYKDGTALTVNRFRIRLFILIINVHSS